MSYTNLKLFALSSNQELAATSEAASEAPATSEAPAKQPAATNTLPTNPNLQPQAEAFRQDVAAKFGLTNIGGSVKVTHKIMVKDLPLTLWYQLVQKLVIKSLNML